jgi:hypothetical protein
VTAYISATDLSAIFPNAVPTLTASSRPFTIAEVNTVIDRIGNELDSAAALAGYAVPIPSTATQAFSQMQLYTQWGAACRVLQVIFPGGGPSSEMPLAGTYCADYKAVLDRIRVSEEPLLGAPADTSEQARELARSLKQGDPTATSGVLAQAEVGMQF